MPTEATNNDRIALTVRTFIIQNYLFGDDSEISNESSLIETGIIDSTGVVELVSHLEETFGIEVADHDLVPDNLDSIARIASFVDAKVARVAS